MVALLGGTSGWVVNDKLVERIWRQEGLKVPTPAAEAEPGPGDRWACARLRAERPNHVRSYDLAEDRTHDGRKFRMLNRSAALIRVFRMVGFWRTIRNKDDNSYVIEMPAP